MASFGVIPSPMPSFGRMMIFIDGENIVFRFQDMLKKGCIPKKSVKHKEDIFVWSPHSLKIDLNEVIRATYYTSVTGDEEKVKDIQNEIKQLTFEQNRESKKPNTLFPQIFKKPKNSAKSKGVDIKMTVDILTHVYSNNVDTVFLISGDGDYKPVIDEIIHNGKQIYLAALSNGLNSQLPNSVDKFIDLDYIYFEK